MSNASMLEWYFRKVYIIVIIIIIIIIWVLTFDFV